MIVNLSQAITLKEMCRSQVIGANKAELDHITITFSREALLGFATEMLWLYEDINENKRVIVETHPLLDDSAPSQAIGFYLTPGSPVLTLKINCLDNSENLETGGINEIFIRHKGTNQFYDVKNPSSETEEGFICLESYELSGRNIVDIGLWDKQERIFNDKVNAITIELNRNGLKDFASMLLVWANNCGDYKEYMIAQNGYDHSGYNLGIALTKDSVPIVLKVDDLGTIYKYDPRM